MKTPPFALLTASFMLTPLIGNGGFASATHAAPVTFDWATVGNAGNAPDTTGFGAVANTYRISKTEVTNAQYTEFLNAVADADPNSLYSASMGSDTRGGITQTGSSPNFTYAVKPDSAGNGPGGDDYTYDNKPVVFVSFFDAMRFTNWLENGQPTGAQGAGTTEAGVYSIGTGQDEVRNPSAAYFIPSEDEWYKAAYYDPSGGTYYDYPTSTDVLADLNNNLPSSDTGNSANFSDGGYTTGDSSYPMTDVGAYAISGSPYGTFDQGGNVWEWNEALIRSSLRGVRGGSWTGDGVSGDMAASDRLSSDPTFEDNFFGFRVASIPEPSTLLLGAMASIGMLMRRRCES